MVRNRKKKIAIIYEGEKTEENIFKSISQHFFAERADIMIMTLPAAGNLYMLWTKLREDNFQTDVISVICVDGRCLEFHMKRIHFIFDIEHGLGILGYIGK